jgi:hypothetical protein
MRRRAQQRQRPENSKAMRELVHSPEGPGKPGRPSGADKKEGKTKAERTGGREGENRLRGNARSGDGLGLGHEDLDFSQRYEAA